MYSAPIHSFFLFQSIPYLFLVFQKNTITYTDDFYKKKRFQWIYFGQLEQRLCTNEDIKIILVAMDSQMMKSCLGKIKRGFLSNCEETSETTGSNIWCPKNWLYIKRKIKNILQ